MSAETGTQTTPYRVEIARNDGRYSWVLTDPLCTYSGRNITLWGAKRNIKRILKWLMEGEENG